MTPIEASKAIIEKEIYLNLQDERSKSKPQIGLGDLVRTAETTKVLSKRDSTNWSYKLYKITESIRDTIPRYRINYLPERCNKNLLRPAKLPLEENKKVMEKLNLIQKNIS